MPTKQSIEKAAQVWCDPRCKEIAMDSRLAEVFAELLDEQDELRIMQLAAISTASIQNTPTTIKDRIGSNSPFFTTAYADTCRAIDREMKLRYEKSDVEHRLSGYVAVFPRPTNNPNHVEIALRIDRRLQDSMVIPREKVYRDLFDKAFQSLMSFERP